MAVNASNSLFLSNCASQVAPKSKSYCQKKESTIESFQGKMKQAMQDSKETSSEQSLQSNNKLSKETERVEGNEQEKKSMDTEENVEKPKEKESTDVAMMAIQWGNPVDLKRDVPEKSVDSIPLSLSSLNMEEKEVSPQVLQTLEKDSSQAVQNIGQLNGILMEKENTNTDGKSNLLQTVAKGEISSEVKSLQDVQHVVSKNEDTTISKESLTTESLEHQNVSQAEKSTGRSVQKEAIQDVSVVSKPTKEQKQDALMPSGMDIPKTPLTDTVQVKVGDVVKVNEGNFSENLGEKIVNHIPLKENEFVIELMPKELGKVTIKLVTEAGKTMVSMTSDNVRTLSLLAEHARGIGLIVENNTGTQTVVQVQEEPAFYEQQKENQGQQQGHQQRHQQESNSNETELDFMQQVRLGLAQVDGWNRNHLI